MADLMKIMCMSNIFFRIKQCVVYNGTHVCIVAALSLSFTAAMCITMIPVFVMNAQEKEAYAWTCNAVLAKNQD